MEAFPAIAINRNESPKASLRVATDAFHMPMDLPQAKMAPARSRYFNGWIVSTRTPF
jgi:hypothetical protein